MSSELDEAVPLSEWQRLVGERDSLRAQLAERDALLRWILATENISADETKRIEAALSASAEPSAPVELDERAAFEARYKVGLGRDPLSEVYYSGANQWRWEGWQARAALERKP